MRLLSIGQIVRTLICALEAHSCDCLGRGQYTEARASAADAGRLWRELGGRA